MSGQQTPDHTEFASVDRSSTGPEQYQFLLSRIQELVTRPEPSTSSPNPAANRLLQFALTPDASATRPEPSPSPARFDMFKSERSTGKHASNPIRDPPSFDGKNFKEWSDRLFLWIHSTEPDPGKVAAMLRETAQGRARYVLNDIPLEVIVDSTPDNDFPNLTKGVAAILQRYRTHFEKSDLDSDSLDWDRFSSLRREGKFSRWNEYISEFRVRHQKAQNAGISVPNPILTNVFVRNSLLSNHDSKLLRMTLAARDLDLKTIHIDRLMELMNTLFGTIDNAEEFAYQAKSKGKGKGGRFNSYSSNPSTNWSTSSFDTGKNTKGRSKGKSGKYTNHNRYTGNQYGSFRSDRSQSPYRTHSNFPSSSQNSSYQNRHWQNTNESQSYKSYQGWNNPYRKKGKGGKRGHSKGRHNAYQADESLHNSPESLIQEITAKVIENIPQSSLRSLVNSHIQGGNQSSMMVQQVDSVPSCPSMFESMESVGLVSGADSSDSSNLTSVPPTVNLSESLELASRSDLFVVDKSGYGILDSACTSSVCSDLWIKNYQAFLDSVGCLRPIEYRRTDVAFRFANDSLQKAEYEASIPVVLGSQTMTIPVTVLAGCTTDLLISRATMEELALSIDFARGTMSSDFLSVENEILPRDCKGNLLLPLFWIDRDSFHRVRDSEHSVSSSPSDDDLDCLNSEQASFVEELKLGFAAKVDFMDPKTITKIHIQFGHASAHRIFKLLYHAHGKVLPRGLNEQFIKGIIDKCETCHIHRKKPIRPRFGGWLSDSFNDITVLDLVECKFHDGEKLILAHLVDVYSGFSYAKIIPSKESKHVVDFLWSWKVIAGRHPRILFTDNGGEFTSIHMESFTSLHDIQHKTTARSHPWSNGMNERHNGMFKEMYNKIVYDQSLLDESLQSTAEGVVSEVVSVLNAIPNETGFSPFFLAFNLPSTPFSFSLHNPQPSQWVNDRRNYLPDIQARLELQMQARDAVFSEKVMKQLHTALKKRVYHVTDYNVGDKVYYRKYEQGYAHNEPVVGPCTIVGREGEMFHLTHADKSVKVPRYDLIPQQDYWRAVSIAFHDSQDSQPDSDFTPTPSLPEVIPIVSQGSDTSTESLESPSKQVHFDTTSPEVRHYDPSDQTPKEILQLPFIQRPARYSSIPGYSLHPKLNIDDVHALCIPCNYSCRKPEFKEVVMKIPGRLVLNNEEHVRLQSMPNNMKLNHRVFIPDVARKMIVETFEDPLTGCTIRLNPETGDKYVSSTPDNIRSSSYTRFFELVTPHIFVDQPHLPTSLPYPLQIIREQLETSQNPTSLGNFHESSHHEMTPDSETIKEQYSSLLSPSSSSSADPQAARLVSLLQSCKAEYPDRHVSDFYCAYLESLGDRPDCLPSCLNTETIDSSVDATGISAYRPPTRQERKLFKSDFENSRRRELESWIENGVFEIVEDYPISASDNVISSRWLENVKEDQSGKIVKFKSRLVIRGFEDKQVDFLQKDAPTVDKNSVKMLLQYAVNNGYDVFSGDISTAFLQGYEYEDVEDRIIYVRPPSGTNEILSASPKALWLLHKAAYGLSDAPRRFYMALKDAFLDSGLKRSVQDFAVFFALDDNGCTIGLLVSHVDDILFSGSQDFHDKIMSKFLQKFRLGSLKRNLFDYCGATIEVSRGLITMSHEHYAKRIILPEPLSGDTERLLTQPEYKTFRTILGKLTWLATTSRPDLAYEVNVLSQHQSNPQVKHMNDLVTAVKNATFFASTRLEFRALDHQNMFLIVFTDASLANNKVTSGISIKHTSQTGTIILIGSFIERTFVCNVVDWQSTKQKRVARSTLTSETLAMTDSIDRAFALKNHYQVTQGLDIPILVIADCQSLVATSHSTTSIAEKRLQIDLGAIRESIERNEIKVVHVNTQHMLADSLTKRMPTQAIRNVMKYHNLPKPVIDAIQTAFDTKKE